MAVGGVLSKAVPILAIILAACAAAANAIASVLQRKATMSAPANKAGPLQLLVNQLHRPAFVGGIGGLMAGFLLQAAALSQGALSVVQSVLAGELPLTLFVASLLFHRKLGAREWLAASMMAAGLAAALAASSPSAGSPMKASGLEWALAVAATILVLGGVAVTGWRSAGPRRAALLGTVAGALFGLTAAFITVVTEVAGTDFGAVFGTWQLYAMILSGGAAVYMLQPAFQAGVLAASQPGITMADPVVATALGVALFGEQLQLGWWVIIEIIGVALVVVGVLVMARSPLLSDDSNSGSGDDDSSEPRAKARAAHRPSSSRTSTRSASLSGATRVEAAESD